MDEALTGVMCGYCKKVINYKDWDTHSSIRCVEGAQLKKKAHKEVIVEVSEGAGVTVKLKPKGIRLKVVFPETGRVQVYDPTDTIDI